MENLNQVLPSLNGVTLYMPKGSHPRELYRVVYADGHTEHAPTWTTALHLLARAAAANSETRHRIGYTRTVSAYRRALHRIADSVARELYQYRMRVEYNRPPTTRP